MELLLWLASVLYVLGLLVAALCIALTEPPRNCAGWGFVLLLAAFWPFWAVWAVLGAVRG